MENIAILGGEIEVWPSKKDMAKILSDGGLSILIGKYSIRIKGCEEFTLREYDGGLGSPVITAYDPSINRLNVYVGKVSLLLEEQGIRHRFEIYDKDDALRGYYHYDWPKV